MIQDNFETDTESKREVKVHKSSMVQDDVEAFIIKTNFNNVNF